MFRPISKIIYTLLFSTLISPALPAAPTEAVISMACVTEFPTTSFIAEQYEDVILMRLIHHNGAKYAPFHDSLTTPNDIDILAQRAQVISKLGDEWNFKWRRSGCNADTPLFFQCIGEAYDFEVNGYKIHPWSITISEKSETSLWGTFDSQNVRLNFSIGSDSHYISMDYQPGECFSLSSPAGKAKLKARLQKIKSKK